MFIVVIIIMLVVSSQTSKFRTQQSYAVSLSERKLGNSHFSILWLRNQKQVILLHMNQENWKEMNKWVDTCMCVFLHYVYELHWCKNRTKFTWDFISIYIQIIDTLYVHDSCYLRKLYSIKSSQTLNLQILRHCS